MKWPTIILLLLADAALAAVNSSPFEALMFYYAYQTNVASVLAQNGATQLTDTLKNQLAIGRCLGTLPDKSCDLNEFLETIIQGQPKDATSARGVKYPDVDALSVELYTNNVNLNFRLYKVIPGETAWPSNNGRPNMADAIKQMINAVQLERGRPTAGSWDNGREVQNLNTAIDRANLWRRHDNAGVLRTELQAHLNNINNPSHVLTMGTNTITIPQSAGGGSFAEPDFEGMTRGVTDPNILRDFAEGAVAGLSEATHVHMRLINILWNGKQLITSVVNRGRP